MKRADPLPSSPARGFVDEWLAGKAAEPTPARGAWSLAPGARLGAWRVGGPLGRGGSCEVYHAERAEGAPRAGALRVLHRSDSAAAARFRREAALLREAPHPALPRLLDAGETPDGRPWMVVEELEKHELPRGDRAVARFLLALCAGLAHLHARGVVHRDVKPSNVLFRADGTPVLIDLGLLKTVEKARGETPALSTLSVVDGRAVGVGTPGYAAPEQFAGGAVTPASDVYALGVLAAACFRDRPPRAWRGLLRRATSAIAAERPQSAAAFARAVRRRHAPAVAGAAAAAMAAAAALAAARGVPATTDATDAAEVRGVPAAAAARAAALEEAAPAAWREVATYAADEEGAVRVTAALGGRRVSLAEPLRLAGVRSVELAGPGRLEAAIEGTPDTLFDVRNAAVIDAATDPDPAHSPRFRLGAGAFVSLPHVLSLWPGDWAEPYAEPDPAHPAPGDRALRFSSPETSLGDQLARERTLAADAALAAEGEEELPVPWVGELFGLTNAVWTTGSANPVRRDGGAPGAVALETPGGCGEAYLRMRFDAAVGDPPLDVFWLSQFAGADDHGGRGGAFEIANRGTTVFRDGADGRPADGWKAEWIGANADHRADLRFRFRSDAYVPPGHFAGVLLKLQPR